jgi:predicted  nucleic acid-binding Zn-ribbon protein
MSEITADSLRSLQSSLNKARRNLSNVFVKIEALEKDLDQYENLVFLNFIYKRNNCEFKGKNENTRQAEIKEYLAEKTDYTDKKDQLEYLHVRKRELQDDLSDLETQLRINLAIFENDRSRANRSILARVIETRSITPPEITAAVEELSEPPLSSFYSEIDHP